MKQILYTQLHMQMSLGFCGQIFGCEKAVCTDLAHEVAIDGTDCVPTLLVLHGGLHPHIHCLHPRHPLIASPTISRPRIGEYSRQHQTSDRSNQTSNATRGHPIVTRRRLRNGPSVEDSRVCCSQYGRGKQDIAALQQVTAFRFMSHPSLLSPSVKRGKPRAASSSWLSSLATSCTHAAKTSILDTQTQHVEQLWLSSRANVALKVLSTQFQEHFICRSSQAHGSADK